MDLEPLRLRAAVESLAPLQPYQAYAAGLCPIHDFCALNKSQGLQIQDAHTCISAAAPHATKQPGTSHWFYRANRG